MKFERNRDTGFLDRRSKIAILRRLWIGLYPDGHWNLANTFHWLSIGESAVFRKSFFELPNLSHPWNLANSSKRKMNGGKKELDADEESKRKALQGIGRVHAEGITQDELTRIYDEWAENYDDDINPSVYKGPEYVAEALSELYKESERKNVKVLDVAAGTGRIGIALHSLGFQNIDALEPSAKMLEILSTHNIYGKQWMDTIGLHQTEIKDNYYDAVVSSGAFGGGHIPVNAIHEMVRVVKSGGYFVIILREEYLTTTEEYSKLEPLLNKLEQGKILKRINRKVVPNYSLDNNGVIFVYQIS